MLRLMRPFKLVLALALILLPMLVIACASVAEAPGSDAPVADESEPASGESDGVDADNDEEAQQLAEAGPPADESGEAPAPATPDIIATGTAVAEKRAKGGIAVPLAEFVAELQARIESKSWTDIAVLAADPIAVAPYRSEWSELPAGRLVSELGTFYLPAQAEPAFSPPGTDIEALLGGMDPTAMLGPDVKVARVLHGTGWGTGASDEVLLFITEAPEGGYRWAALLWTSGAFGDS